jgi:plastocyanin
MQAILGPRPKTRVAAATVAVALAAALLAGPPAPRAEGRGQPERRRADAPRVEIDNFSFGPQTLRIARGTRVVFANRDRITHTATRRGSFDTGRIRPGHAVAVRFGRPGVYSYVCKIHSFMHGKIVVR